MIKRSKQIAVKTAIIRENAMESAIVNFLNDFSALDGILTACGAFRESDGIAKIPISCEKENIDRMSFSLSVHVALLEKRLRYKYRTAPVITRKYTC